MGYNKMLLDKKTKKNNNNLKTLTTRCTGKGSGGVVWLVAEIDEPQ